MKTAKITNKTLFSVFNAANSYYESTDKEAPNKLTYALQKFVKANMKFIDAYKERESDLNIEYASVDEKKNLIKNATGFVFTKEMQRSLNAAIKELNNAEIEVEIFEFVKPEDIPYYLPVAFKELFTGIVI